MTPRGVERRIRQHVLGRTHEFFAVVQPGFERTASRELSSLGIDTVLSLTTGGIEFSARLDTLYEICIRTRNLTRILMRLGSFQARRFDTLRSNLSSFPWELYLPAHGDIGFRISCRASRLYHTGRIEDEARTSVTRRLARLGIQPTPEGDIPGIPAQTVYIRMNNDNCQLSIDASGVLYRRGDKTMITGAPLRETLASLILCEARSWEYESVLDPMCGSGTFSLEAAAVFAGRAPGVDRTFPFMGWPCFRSRAYAYLKRSIALGAKESESALAARSTPAVFASDIDVNAVHIAQHNIKSAGLDRFVSVSCKDFFKGGMDIPSPGRNLVVLNPPFGKRIEMGSDDLFERIGRMCRHYNERGYAIIVPGIEYEKKLGLVYDRKIPFIYGGIRVAVLFRDGTAD